MIYLILAILTSTLIIITFRIFERFNISRLQAITVNYLVAAGFGFMSKSGSFQFSEIPGQSWFISSLIIGITLIVAFNLFALSTRHAGVSITAISSRMSVIIPVSLGFLVFGDTAGWLKITGIILALIAFYFSSKRSKTLLVNKKHALLPALLFMAVGLNDSMMKVAEHFYVNDDFVVFLATSFSIALLLGIIVLASGRKCEKFEFKNIIAGIVLGLLNWYSTLYFLRGLDLYQVSFFVPIYNVGVVTLASLSGFVFFNEKLTMHKLIGIGLAIIAIILIAQG
ncbi:MAG TPA: EamA family transporter [Bacteroidales bacterium]|nr:EamA family transporter [Bacteroidales bacterium]HPR58329.1 EamA family transporter [Bacteroidales bacterium]HRW97013.1 EamA family transporter [Bacteroidales bacterium]